MIGFVHQTVLQSEVAALLAAGPGRVIFDGTLGGGGHAQALLDAGARVVAIDQDPAALAAARARLSGRDVVVAHGNFRDARAVLDQLGFSEVDGALFDLGVSSPQLDDPGRGFSFRADGPLDMRMDPTQGESAAEFLARAEQQQIQEAIRDYGEERFAKQIAAAIVAARGREPIVRTRQLADLVAKAVRTREPG